MTALKTYRHFQDLVKQTKSRTLYEDWEKIDRIREELRVKALEEIKVMELEKPKIVIGELKIIEPEKRPMLWKKSGKLLLNFIP